MYLNFQNGSKGGKLYITVQIYERRIKLSNSILGAQVT